MKTIKQNKIITDDPIAEVRRIREEIAAEHDYDIDSICAEVMRRQKTSGHRYVDRSRKRKAIASC